MRYNCIIVIIQQIELSGAWYNLMRKIKIKKNDFICIGLLTLVYLTIIIIITRFKFAYGSTMDWDSQHYAIPEYFRNLFYETKNFFPSFAQNLGAGQNIYNFSYYGLFNPLILLSYFLPFVSMSAYIQSVSMISVLVSSVMCYFWIKRRYETKIAFLISCLFLLASPIIFHSHRHIMFVSYLPFFIGALFCCDKFFEKKNRAGLIFCMAMIMLISYYYSIGSYLAIFVYITALYLNKNPKFKIKEYLKCILNLAVCTIISIMITAVLWLPTIYEIISCRAKTNVSISLKEILLPTVNYNSVLYSPYSMGLMIISLMAILFVLIKRNRGKRFLGIVVSLFVLFDLLIYAMNGFMYADEKALIPFVPLVLLLTAEFVKAIFQKEISVSLWSKLNAVLSVLGVVNILLEKKYIYLGVLIIDFIVLNTAYLIYTKKGSAKAFISIVTALTFVFCLKINLSDRLSTKDDLLKVDTKYAEEIENASLSAEYDNLYRTALLADTNKTLNKVYNKNYYLATIYSSLQNKLFNHFYFNEFQNEMPYRNSAMMAQTANPFFYTYMGEKYLFVENKTLKEGAFTVPNGYKEVLKGDYLTLFKNDDVMSLGYASAKLMSKSQYSSLAYPYNMMALMNYTVVDKDIDNVTVDGIQEIDLSNELFENLPENIDYDKSLNTVFVNIENNNKKIGRKSSEKGRSAEKDKYTVDLKTPIDDYLIITCEADNKIGKKSADIFLTINGIKNKLTDPSWKYYNNNGKFCFVLSSSEPIDTLDFYFSKGEYKLSDWRFYTVSKSKLQGLRSSIDEFKIDRSKTKGDVYEGTVNVTEEDSLFKLTVPYADGFSAYVDGEKTEIVTVDNTFIGFEISKGSHNIKVVYTAPLLNISKLVSLIGVLMFVIIFSAQLVTKKKAKAKTCKG